MPFTDTFNTKVVNNKDEEDRKPVVTPKAQGGGTLVVTMFSEAFFKEIVGYNTRQGKSVDTMVDLEIYPDISDGGKDIIFINKVLRDVLELDTEIFRAVERGLEKEVGYIKRDKLGVFSREDAIYDKLDEIQGSIFWYQHHQRSRCDCCQW